MSTYKNRSRDKGNINSDYIRATQTGVNAVNASKLSASNLIPNYPIKTDNLNVLQSTKLSISDTNGLQNALDNAGGIQYNGTIPAPIGNLVKINDVDGNVEDSTITEAIVNGKLDKAGDTMSGNLNLGSNDIDSVGNIEAATLDGVQLISGTNAQDLLLNNAGFNIKIPSCNLDLNNNSIENVNNLQTNSISSTTTDININNELNLNNFDIRTVDLMEINDLKKNGTGDIRLQDNIDVNNFDLKFVSNIDAVNLDISSINNITPVGGLYSGISDGNIINQASGQSDLLPISSVGSLDIPANGFQVGDAYHLVVAGTFPTEQKNDDITIEIKQNGTSLGILTLQLKNPDATSSNFEVEADFIIRSVGVAGSLASNIDFTFNEDVDSKFEGTRSTTITTIDTTTASTLSVLAQVNGTGSSIQSRLAYLRKQY